MKKHLYNILCIDDVEDNLYAYELILSKIEEVKVFKASSGNDALKMLLRQEIDLILLDIQMPEMDGYEVAKLLKSTHQTQHIPIVFITAVFKSEEFIAKGFEVGAVDYLTKPLDDNLLINRIYLYLSIFKQKRQAEENLELFYMIAQGIGDGLYVTNKNGILEFINDTALDILGYTKEELSNLSIHEKIHAYDIRGHKVPQSECPIHSVGLINGVSRIDEDIVRTKNGTLLPVMSISSIIQGSDHQPKIVTLFRDRTKDLEYKNLQKHIIDSKNEMLWMLIDAIDKRDPYTAGHTKRVAIYCELIAKGMDYSKEDIDLLIDAAHLHDIGKISTPDVILLKPTHFEADEYEIMKLHLQTGYELLMQTDDYKEIAEVMRYHHERCDGTGYPMGISGDAIPPLARIMMVADAFDAMTTNRIYKKSKSVSEALAEIKQCSGKQFHPEVAETAQRVLKDINIQQYHDQTPNTPIEEKRFAFFYHDRLTGSYNAEYLPVVLESDYVDQKVYIYKLNTHKMNQYNREHGWEAGNLLLKSLCNEIVKKFKHKHVFRISGDDFLVISKENDINEILSLSAYLKKQALYLEISLAKYTLEKEDRDYSKLLLELQ